MTRTVLLALGIAFLAAGCLGSDARSERPKWLTDTLEQKMTRNALFVKRNALSAEVDRAFVVRSTATDVARLGGWDSARSGTVYVLELWGKMILCHGAPPRADPCARTEGVTVVYDAATLQTRDVVYGRLGAERLGQAFDLSIARME